MPIRVKGLGDLDTPLLKIEGALNLIITLVFLNLGLISMAITNIVEAVCKIVDLILLLKVS